ncbi:MAG: hypothetical protein WD426_14300 [Anditalea sp.]
MSRTTQVDAVQMMGAGPSDSGYRPRLQTASKLLRLKAVVVSVRGKGRSALNAHAAFDVAGTGNITSDLLAKEQM